ncbi:MAG: hypothetical protein LH473_05825 [Chitinophagales bacterium]|nr:hypothetical protein [Chitinophagales bacterium]
MSTRFTIEYMQEIAVLRKGRCLSKEYWDYSTPLTWKCNKGHTWDAPYSIIIQGSWCRQCLKDNEQELKLIEMQHIAEGKGGKCLSTKYLGSKIKLQWQCANGHIWMAIPNYIKSSGLWCSECSGHLRLTIEQMKKIAEEKGGKCLSTVYKNSSSMLNWQCSEGHVWQANSSSIRVGHWCKKCAYKKNGLKRRLHINDLRKIAAAHGGQLLSKIYLNNFSPLKWKCSKGHTWNATANAVTSQKTWCPRCAGVAKHTIEQMKLLAQQFGGKCISSTYVNIDSKLKWQCKNGHEWEANALAIQRGSWCKQCPSVRSVPSPRTQMI